MVFKRVLLFGQTFNDFSGGGITLSNLFKDWPRENLAVVSYPFMLHNSSTDICKNYYQIGREELTWRFPFSLIKQKFQSGMLQPAAEGRVPVLSDNKKLKHSISSNILTPVMKWSGLVHWISFIHLSTRLKTWISDFDPDVLYFQISNRESIKFAEELIVYLNIPSVIHMMDDWPLTISARGPFKRIWHKKIDREFRSLLYKTSIQLSISEAMSSEYLQRYGTKFAPFHNPVDPECFNIVNAPEESQANRFKILYLGRVGTANDQSLKKFAVFISKYQPHGMEIEFDIYTKDYLNHHAQTLGKMNNVNVRGAIRHEEIQFLMMKYDLLVLPLDFTSRGLKFSRFSIPTKASEYMMSGTPILIFAPAETAISEFCSRNECGHCVNSQDNNKLKEALDLLIENKEYRKRLANRAREISDQMFNGTYVRRSFRDLINSLQNSTVGQS